jgi:acetolactate synthase-1/2/3 large subunit
MNASQLFVKALEHEGVTHIFGVPGEENLDFLEALRTSSITFVTTRHEQVAGFMAATYGRLTGKVGVCLSTLGPGATNFVTAAAHAQLGAMPMLMITGQKPIRKSKQGHFQIIDTVAMMRPITKFAKQIVEGVTIPTLVREAVRRAEDERPGAVLLELPEDIAAEEVGEVPLFPVYKIRRPAAEDKAIAHAADLIIQAKRPLLLIGAAANRKLTAKALREFVDATGIHFFTTQMGKGVIDERHAQYLGCAALSSKDIIHRAVAEADVIINVGHDVIEKPPFFMTPEQTVIHVNYLPAEVDPIYFPQWQVIGDIGNAMWQLSEKLKGESVTFDTAYVEKVKSEIEQHLVRDIETVTFPIIPQRLVSDIRSVMPDDGIVSLDNGMYKLWFTRYYKAYGQNTILMDNALATMGAGLPAGMMAKMVHPDRKVLVVAGDGGFMMNSQDLETAIRLKLNLVILVLVDNQYGMIDWKQKEAGMEAYSLQFGNPDFMKYAEAYGATGHRLEKTEEFKSLLEAVMNTSGVHVIEVPIDYSQNESVFGSELQHNNSL